MNNMCLIIAVAIVCAAGCSFNPPNERPAPPVAAQWPDELAEVIPAASKVGAGKTAVLAPLGEDNWRAFFSDAGLQQAITAALADNRDLAVAVARVAEARAQAGIAAADLRPTVDGVVQRNANHIPAGVDGRERTTSRFDGNLALSWELDFWGRVASLDAATRATFMASDFAARAFRLSLIADVANAWFGLEEALQRELLLGRIVDARIASSAAIEKRRVVGLANELEVLTAEGSLQSARSEFLGAQRSRVIAANGLRALVGRELPADWLPVVRPSDQPADLRSFPAVAIGLPAEAILRRPDVLAAEQRLTAARANIGAARAAFLPRVTLTASAGNASSDLDSLFVAGSGAWSFLPVLRIPLFDGGRRTDALNLAQAREHIAVADYERVIQQAFREIADGLATARYGRAQAEAAHAASSAQVKRLQQVEARYRAGLANYLELLDAQRDSLNALISQYAARRQVLSAATAVFKAIGGV